MAPNSCSVKMTLEEIPQKDGPEWDAFCKKYDVYPLASGRRGWSGRLNTYVRGAKYVGHVDGAPIDFFYEDDIKRLTEET